MPTTKKVVSVSCSKCGKVLASNTVSVKVNPSGDLQLALPKVGSCCPGAGKTVDVDDPPKGPISYDVNARCGCGARSFVGQLKVRDPQDILPLVLAKWKAEPPHQCKGNTLIHSTRAKV